MTNEQINIAIVKSLGWKFVDDDPDFHPYMEDPYGYKFEIGAFGMNCRIPDYCNDLNAIHEAEKTLNPIQAAEYARILTSIAWQSEQPVFAPMTAKADQRAEAFLRTLGKWKEETK
jgi:hypothetical protein